MEQQKKLRTVFLACILLMFLSNLYAASVQSIVYISSVKGNDETNNGSQAKPYKTFGKAMINTDSNATIIVRGGDYYEDINISEQPGRKGLIIKSYSGERVRILCGEKIDTAEKVQGFSRVYKKTVTRFANLSGYRIFQHDIEDKTTLISPEERHPLQKGKLYRCNSTPLVRVNSQAGIDSVNTPAFYFDSKQKVLYFSITEGSDLSKNPIYLPTENGLYGGNNEIELTIIGIEVLYGSFNVSRCSGAKIIDCAAKYAFNAGGFIYNMSVGIEFTRCEAARTFTGARNGDGFNGHSKVAPETNPDAKHTTVMLVDCWSHDNYDDGYSNHERCEGVVRGGLFEYNNKFGVGSGYGAHEVIYDAISRRNNQYGFAVCADVLTNEGGYASQMTLHDCIAEGNNSAGYVAYTSNEVISNPNSMILYDCYSINNKVGFEVRDKTLLTLINCKDSGSETLYRGKPLVKSIENLK